MSVIEGKILEESFDVDLYLGTWFEIGHSPNWFQNKSNFDTKAVYTRLSSMSTDEEKETTFGVENVTRSKKKISFTKNSIKETSVQGTARQIDSSKPNQLNVQFSPFKYKGSSLLQKGLNIVSNWTNSKSKANYIIYAVGLGSPYQLYRWAVVGDPKSQNCWILSRTSSMDDNLIQQLLGILSKNQFSTGNFIFTSHTSSV